MANELYQRPGQTGDPASGAAAVKVFSPRYLDALYHKGGAWKAFLNFDAEVRNQGESVTIPIMPALTAADVSLADGTYTANATSITSQTVTVNQYKAVGYKVPQNVFLEAAMDVEAALAKNAANAVADSIDTYISTLIASFTNNSAGTNGSDLDEDKVLAALQTLVVDKVDMSNPRDLVWILPATQYAVIKKLTGYGTYTINADASGNLTDIRPVVNTLYDIPVWFRSDSGMTVSGGKIGLLAHQSAIAVAVQRNVTMEPPVRIPGSVNVELLTTALFGASILDQNRGCKILTK